MADARLVARALAEAFFAGPFQARSLAKRGERVLGARPEWLIALASRFARRRSADVDAAVERILESDGFSVAANGVVIRTWLFREPVIRSGGDGRAMRGAEHLAVLGVGTRPWVARFGSRAA